MWTEQTNRDLSSNSLAGIVNEIDCHLKRPVDPINEAQVRDLALGYASWAVARHPDRDFGERSVQMRTAIMDDITKAYFSEMQARRHWWPRQLQLLGTHP